MIVPLMMPPVIEQGIGVDVMKLREPLIVQLVSMRLKPVPETVTAEPRGPRSGDTITVRGTMFNVVEAWAPAVPPPVTVIVYEVRGGFDATINELFKVSI